MTALFADTFYWIALFDSSDTAHRQALALPQGGGWRIISSPPTKC
jgi:hypothetical protein